MKEIKDLGFGVIQVNETKPTISKMESVDNYLCKWQKLKEWLEEQLEYILFLENKFNKLKLKAQTDKELLQVILNKMQELEGEDE